MEGKYDPQKEVGYPGIAKSLTQHEGITLPAKQKHAENILRTNLRHISGKQTPEDLGE